MDYFLIWATGAAATSFFFGLTQKRKELLDEYMLVTIACVLWPVTMPIVFFTWLGMLARWIITS